MAKKFVSVKRENIDTYVEWHIKETYDLINGGVSILWEFWSAALKWKIYQEKETTISITSKRMWPNINLQYFKMERMEKTNMKAIQQVSSV